MHARIRTRLCEWKNNEFFQNNKFLMSLLPPFGSYAITRIQCAHPSKGSRACRTIFLIFLLVFIYNLLQEIFPFKIVYVYLQRVRVLWDINTNNEIKTWSARKRLPNLGGYYDLRGLKRFLRLAAYQKSKTVLNSVNQSNTVLLKTEHRELRCICTIIRRKQN